MIDLVEDATGQQDLRGLPVAIAGSSRSLVVARSSLQVRGARRATEGPSGTRSGERCSLRRVGVCLIYLAVVPPSRVRPKKWDASAQRPID